MRGLARERGMPNGVALAFLSLAQANQGQRREAMETASSVLRVGPELQAVPVAARALSPVLHELRAQLARVRGDEPGCERERATAELLFAEMGAHLHIERMARELEELRPPRS
jgi:hypothetical protein